MATFSKPVFRPDGVFLNISRPFTTESGLTQRSTTTAQESMKNKEKLLNYVSTETGENHCS